MIYSVFILISGVLLIGFFVLTWYEKRHGVRLLAEKRAQLDQNVARIEFIWTHIDLGAFARDELRRAMSFIGHHGIHISLRGVRTVERFLTRLARHFRTQRAPSNAFPAPRESTRTFVKTLTDFKGRLKATHPPVSDITAGEVK